MEVRFLYSTWVEGARRVGIACLGVLAAGCAAQPQPAPHVLLISVDTCRPDRLGPYGATTGATPRLDALAAQATVFEHAYSPVPVTLPAHASMLSGTIPPFHGVQDNGEVLPDRVQTLAEMLSRRGRATVGVVGSFALDSRFGIAQGFGSYDDRFDESVPDEQVHQRRCDEVSRKAIEWLERHDGTPFFMFVHYFDPHRAYDPPEPFRSRFPHDPYSGEIASVDHCIGQVLDELERRRWLESTLVIVTGDHGEMLGEHGEQTHSYFIYESAVRVPMIVKLPGQSTPLRIAEPVSLIDIPPTVLGFLGIEALSEVQGIDLSAALRGQAALDPDRFVYCQSFEPTKYGCNPLLGGVAGPWKYIETTRPELYEVRRDPAESTNQVSGEPEVARRMGERLHATLEVARRSGDDSTPDPEARRRLRALGYVTGVTGSGIDVDPDRPDPKDRIAFHALDMVASKLLQQQSFDEVAGYAEEMIDQQPALYQGYAYLGQTETARGRPDRAASLLQQAVEREASDPVLHGLLARALLESGDPEAAVQSYDRAIELDHNYAEAHSDLGLLLRKLGKPRDAERHLRRALEIVPDHVEALNNLANLYLTGGNAERALPLYQRAAALRPELPQLQYNLGIALERLGWRDEALSRYRRTVELAPGHTDARRRIESLEARP